MAHPGKKESSAAAGGMKKNSKVDCLACGCADARDGENFGLACVQGHYICNSRSSATADTCLHNFLSGCLEPGKWLTHVPIKCPVCRVDYNPVQLEALFNAEESKLYTTACITVQVATNEDEALVTCPFCSFAAVYDKHDRPLLFFCGNPSCAKRSCGVCLLETTTDQIAERHLCQCGEWGSLYREMLDIVERNSKGACPGCGVMGVKDDNCCHMKCFRCETQWCYMCGRSADDADKPANSAWPIGHQEDWKQNPLRCPIYLSELHQMVDECPDNPSGCREYFHRYRTLRALKKKVDQVGRNTIEKLLAIYPGALGGYPLGDVIAFNEQDFLRRRLY